MIVPQLSSGWHKMLSAELAKPYFKDLKKFLDQEYKQYTCFPPQSHIFNAFNHCSLSNLKVVIIGQDPYHGLGQANGMCFSVSDKIQSPPSLKNIYKELQADLGVPIPDTGDLQRWAKQGVLLLNATLTVRESQAGSHQKQGWETFTDAVIREMSAYKDDLVFLLWGGFAKKKGAKIDKLKHCVLSSGHPSPLSANQGYWFGNKHFSKANKFLSSKCIEEIVW